MSKLILAAIAAFFIGLYAGATYFPQHHYPEKIIEKPAEIKETVRHEVETVVQYVAKETTPGSRIKLVSNL